MFCVKKPGTTDAMQDYIRMAMTKVAMEIGMHMFIGPYYSEGQESE